MPWIQLKIDTSAKSAEKIGDALSEAGALAVTFVDAKDTPMYEPKPGEVMLWQDTQVVGLFEAETDIALIAQDLIEQKVISPDVRWKADPLEDKDWEREWMDNFHPMKFGEQLWVCPSWRDIPDPDAVNVMLDPGLAFGTGTHPTTSLCLQWLDSKKAELQRKTFVDFGCGSGILSVAALKLGAQKGIGIDIDPQALQATKENARRNNVESLIDVYLPANQPELQADFVFANILSGPLIELFPVISNYCKPEGRLVLSGILAEQIQRLEARYGQHFELDKSVVEGEWARVSGTKFTE